MDFTWLFVLGVNNSGTTLLARLLAAHPEIAGLPDEGHRLTRALRRPWLVGEGRLWANELERYRLDPGRDAEVARECRDDWSPFAEPGARYLVEKSPPDTVRLPWLRRHFRPGRFVSIVRRPHAVCEGIRRRIGADLEAAAAHWSRANAQLLDDVRDERPELLAVRYERLCADPAAVLEEIRGFLGLAERFDDAVVARVGSHTMDGETTGVVDDLDARSAATLAPGEVEAIERIAGVTMDRLGYARLAAPGVLG